MKMTSILTLLTNTSPSSILVHSRLNLQKLAYVPKLDQFLQEFYHHIFRHGNEAYLAVQRGKHRGHMIKDEKKFFILPMPNNLMPIPDDINDEGPVLRRVGVSSAIGKEDEDLMLIN